MPYPCGRCGRECGGSNTAHVSDAPAGMSKSWCYDCIRSVRNGAAALLPGKSVDNQGNVLVLVDTPVPEGDTRYFCIECESEVSIPKAILVPGKQLRCPRCRERYEIPKSVRLDCPNCKKEVEVAVHAYIPGQQESCRACGKAFKIPSPSEASLSLTTHGGSRSAGFNRANLATKLEVDVTAAVGGSPDGIKRLAAHTAGGYVNAYLRHARLLVSANAKDLLPRLVVAMASEDHDLQNAAARLLGILGPEVGPEGTQALIRAVQSQHQRLRMTAIEALGEVGGKGGVGIFDALSRLLPNDPNDRDLDSEKIPAIAAVGKTGDPRARQALEKILAAVHEGGRWFAARQAAAYALGEIRDPASVPALQAAVNHDTSLMFHPVTRVLIDLAPDEAATLLLRFTNDKSYGTEAVGYLEELLASQSRHVSVHNLQLTARLTGVRSNVVEYGGTNEDYGSFVSGDAPVSCQIVNELAKKELRQRGVRVAGCFIATAACATADHPDVMVLRRLREEVLAPSPWGSRLVAVYEALSPPLANHIAHWRALRLAVRHLIVRPSAAMARRFFTKHH